MECLQCKNEFISSRPDKKFCSPSCRVKYSVNRSEAMNSNKNVALPVANSPLNMGYMGLSGNASFDYIFQKTERENAELKAENKQLSKDLEASKEKFRELKLEIDTRSKLEEADKSIKESQGLGGFIEKVTANDRLMGALEKIALAKFGVSEKSEDEDILAGVGENRMLLETVIALISEKDQDFLAHFVKVTQYFSTNPTILVSLSNNIAKQKPNETTA